ncbi:MAG: DUF4145 domain-containing protein [Pseudomonadota bacterium]|nr:DUF4145 domain-containing protein [Pseudomonadota bacterium]
MATFVTDCQRCGAVKSTFECYSSIPVRVEYDWKVYCEVFSVCRHCKRSSTLVLAQRNYDKSLTAILKQTNKITETSDSISSLVEYTGFVSSSDRFSTEPPEHLPQNIHAVMLEANKCMSVQCWNAAGAMFRLALDLATKSLVPVEGAPAARVVRSLGLRLQWLFDHNLLSADLKMLAECLQQDGNDGAHDGTLTKADAEDLSDFCFELLNRLYTERERLRLAEERRVTRREK